MPNLRYSHLRCGSLSLGHVSQRVFCFLAGDRKIWMLGLGIYTNTMAQWMMVRLQANISKWMLTKMYSLMVKRCQKHLEVLMLHLFSVALLLLLLPFLHLPILPSLPHLLLTSPELSSTQLTQLNSLLPARDWFRQSLPVLFWPLSTPTCAAP